MTIPLLIAMECALQVNENLTIYSLVPPDAGQGWKLELFALAEPIAPHYHKLQRQMILVAEGDLKAFYEGETPVSLRSGEIAQVEPGIVHSLIPEGTVRFFSIDFPGFHFPEDVFYDIPPTVSAWTPPNSEFLPSLDPKYFGQKIDLGSYAAYELVTGHLTDEKWSLALLEIQDSPRHFHRIEKEIFVIVGGELDIEIEGKHRKLGIGESIAIFPNQVHHLKSAGREPVRVLCFSFPAFDPSDMYCLD